MGEAVEVAGSEDEGAAELEGITAEFALAAAGGAGAFAVLEIVPAEEMKKVGFAEVGDFVGLAVRVNEEREIDAGFLLKETGVIGIAEANGGESGVLFAEGLLVLAQLRDVFAAEDSAVMAKEDEDGGIRLPERAEADLVAKGVGKDDSGEPLAEGVGHDGT